MLEVAQPIRARKVRNIGDDTTERRKIDNLLLRGTIVNKTKYCW